MVPCTSPNPPLRAQRAPARAGSFFGPFRRKSMSTQLSAIGSEAEMLPAVLRCPASRHRRASRRLGVFLLHWGHRHSQCADAFDLTFELVADRDLPDAGWCSG